MTFASGHAYDGDWVDDKRHGAGTYTYASGDKYTGELRDDKFAGRGRFEFASGNVFEGEFEDNKRVRGVYTLASGDVFEGGWRNDKFSGRGTYTLPSGAAYAGPWKRGKIHVAAGPATVTLPGGAVVSDPAAVLDAWRELCPRLPGGGAKDAALHPRDGRVALCGGDGGDVTVLDARGDGGDAVVLERWAAAETRTIASWWVPGALCGARGDAWGLAVSAADRSLTFWTGADLSLIHI